MQSNITIESMDAFEEIKPGVFKVKDGVANDAALSSYVCPIEGKNVVLIGSTYLDKDNMDDHVVISYIVTNAADKNYEEVLTLIDSGHDAVAYTGPEYSMLGGMTCYQ